MQISMRVPYDEKRLRRTLQFILRPQLRLVRILGGVLIVLGLALVALDPSTSLAYVALVLGLLFVFAIAPITVARSVRMQSNVIRDGLHLTLDDEWVTLIYPLVESRLRWAGLDRVIETPEVWYIMFGKIQAITVPKEPMTEEQRAEFGAFVNGLHPAGK
ncbi:YcxB family protein [Micromonospora sp. DR5-3]|uniref:YcxB family protein n=1 Tax=unclassified Micromonospora TaxID=2617518 RepID=UPI0011DB5DB7|nr:MULTISPECIES: YcxB family protein [unclassified Micromonospora]MCW3816884.1 YcxB family protein [Micromonospora sp. DR5-3]TYC23390.1 YcxB family protein [Micromonospora sp. MP36]